MKKLTFLTVMLFCGAMLATKSARAQEITAGGGVGYGSQSENLNFHVNMYYRLPELPVRVGADVGYSVPEKNAQSRVDQIEGNINSHLMAVDNDMLSLYGLTGLNIMHSRFKYEPAGAASISDSNTNLGVNVGAGAELDIGFGRTYGEAKYIIGREDVSQLVLGVGVRLSL
ncbi:outer membrane protein [Fodinibius sediminis]|uniref:Outer membrane protein beta-barrel domain-containing protein n=1 Tax=Fodinibius sediminis TaxID=1214077 RepID=A0A521ARZ3_9BACT|nr:outer membrane beta-barrel protein [Fodinibius sediminis]SMO37556.1 Outer membrane protein beta-barrel domain-containing protein [Fodinibius sediminis]